MKKLFAFFIVTFIATLTLTGCWNPDMAAVPITAPWDTMNLPVKEEAIVWQSDAQQLKILHKDNKKTVLLKYVGALEPQGWKLTRLDDKSEPVHHVELAKGEDKLAIEIYDFDNTGVIIKKNN